MSTPDIPSLNLEAATAEANAALDKKKSFGKKIASSFKKAMTPRTGSSSNLDAVAAAAENGAAEAAAAVTSAAETAKTQATDAAAAAQSAAKTEASRLGKAAEAAKADVEGAVKKAAGEAENKAPALVAIGALVAIVAVVLTAVAGNKKKPEPVAPPKKKGLW